MLSTHLIVKLLIEYGQDVRDVLRAFEHEFGIVDSIKKWRSSNFCRVGKLEFIIKGEYAFHGAGCTVETASGKVISFDLNESNNYKFDSFKFRLYAESLGLEVNETPSALLEELAEHYFWIDAVQ